MTPEGILNTYIDVDDLAEDFSVWYNKFYK